MRVTAGEIFDAVVDKISVRKTVCARLSAMSTQTMGSALVFADGFLPLFESAAVLYKAEDYSRPDFEYCIRWNDCELALACSLAGQGLLLSTKDRQGAAFRRSELFE